jgi:hypothetical protein
MRSTACSTRGGAWWPSTSGQRPGRGSVTSSGCCASGQGGTMPNVSERCSARRASRHGRDGVHWSSCPGLRAGMEAACGARLASQVDGRLRCQRPGIDNPPHSLCTAVGFPRRPLGCEFGRLRSRLACVTSKEGRDRPSRARSPTEIRTPVPTAPHALASNQGVAACWFNEYPDGTESSQRFRPGGLMKTSTDGVDSRRPSPPGKMLS